jgi:protein transport protein SEC24
MSTDTRVYNMRMLSGMSVSDSVATFYPRGFGVHDMDGDEGCWSEELGRVLFPKSVRGSVERMDGHGVYMWENGLVMYMWVGKDVHPQLCLDLFGVAFEELGDVQELPVIESEINCRVRVLVEAVQKERGRFGRLSVVREGGDEGEIRAAFVEDKNCDNMDYGMTGWMVNVCS